MHHLQAMLICSRDAKLIAVRRVTTLNKGKFTPGVDRQKFVTTLEKEKLVRTLKLDGKALPIRRVWIPKPGKLEKRPLGIPTIRDRAKQALAHLALEPEWEAVFEPNSYGFRPGRRAQDAIEAIFSSLHHGYNKWVYDADIKKCFDRINHEVLVEKLNTFPMMKTQIIAWLKADIMEGYSNAPKSRSSPQMGTPQGGIISPLLANIALHGLENHLKEYVGNLPIKPRESSNRGKSAKMKALSVIRYADDFVLIHVNKEVMELCIQETKNWLLQIGLEISEEKSSLKEGSKGFLFLGFQTILLKRGGRYKVKIRPSKQSILRFLLKIREVIQNNKAASAYQLITKLRPIIVGWANYYKYSECSRDFHRLTNLIFQKIRAWVFRRDTRNGRNVIKEKYFPSGQSYTFNGTTHKDNWILVGKYKNSKGTRETFLPHIVWIKSVKHVKVKDSKSPYDGDYIYWKTRMTKYASLSTRLKTLISRQKIICPLCKQKFTTFDSIEIDHVIPKNKGGKDTYDNLQALHRHCHVRKTAGELT